MEYLFTDKMRIMFFPKLVRDEETRQHCLKDCSLVIDGNNFFYDSYEQSKLFFAFGSEANEHARYLRSILNMFKKANITCYFVFKGGNTDMVKKLQKGRAVDFDFDSNYTFVPPVFLKAVCKQVLQEAGIKYATCVMESKDDCVALARRLECSVLSNDIEYCFKNAPYIPHTTLKYARNGILCGQYNIEDFLNKYSLTREMFAIFAALTDTNIFPQNHFNELFQQWGVNNMNLYLQNKNILKWLSRHTEVEIVDNVLEFLTKEKEKFLKVVETILTSKDNEQTGIVVDYLYNRRQFQISRFDPLWFDKGVATQNIPLPYINLYKHKLIEGSWTKKGATDNIMLSIDIITYAYNLLTNFQQVEFSIVYQPGDNYIKINTRDSNIKKPKHCGTQSVFHNGWAGIKRLKLFEHFLKGNNINTDVINKLPEEIRMLVITLTYFARKKAFAGVDVTKQACCFIICHVMLRVVRDRQDSLRKTGSGITEVDATEAIQATEEYMKCDIDKARQIYEEDEVKTMVELQLCLAHMNYLNTLCGRSYKPTMYHRSYNGTFIYQLFHAMRDHNEDQFVEELFRAAPSVYKYTASLIRTYKQLA